jgi:hypothetical protein
MEPKKKKQTKKSPQDRELQALKSQMATIAKRLSEQAPAAVSGSNPASKSKPKFTGSAKGCVLIEHREVFVWPIGTASYAIDSATVNPGHSIVFPWLSKVAQRFEEYRFRYLRFRYYPRCGTGQAGEIVIGFDPKSGDQAPQSLQILNTYHIRAQGPQWKEHVLNIPRDVLNGTGRRRFVTPGAPADLSVRSLYDVGKILFAKDGSSPSGAIIGEISVEYGVELYVPTTDPDGGTSAGWARSNGGETAAAPYGSAPTYGGNVIDDVSVNTVFFRNLLHNFTQDVYYTLWASVVGTGITSLSATGGGGGSVSNVLTTINGGATVLQYHGRFKSGESGFVQWTLAASTVTEFKTQLLLDSSSQSF